jgi:imidazolonepropionase-like amidohydrolase
MEVYRHNFAILAKHGVRIAIGCDQFRSTSVREAIEIHKARLITSPLLLRALSSDAAATIFPERAPFGLTEGAPADFLVFESSPLASGLYGRRTTRQRIRAGQPLD